MKTDQLSLEHVQELDAQELVEICGGKPNIHSGLVYDIVYEVVWFASKIVKNTIEGKY